MALPANFLDELRARTPIAGVIGRSVKLTRSGRDTKGCCPFHGEKTPSFYVYDDHFHCFGCGEHGDVITFVMKTTGAGFMEAVESLAQEAGLEVPKASPQAAQAEQRRAGISEVLEAAGKIFQRFLHEPQGKSALDYLRGRGLSEETIRRFGLGWSGEGRGVLAAALRGQGIKPEQLIEAGLMKQGEHGPVDMFFSRVMFPITDRRGNVISFGGRIMGDGQPKYVNGPETPVFSKRRSLYGLHLARDAVRKGAQLIVVEGYIDVIALAQGGFGGAVAPLGTALTEEHLAEVWRLSPEPVICFDGDAAGRRAALKTVDLALTALAPDRSLKFLNLPEKDDPDSLIRREGPAAFKARLDGARPISAALYDMLAEGGGRATPEARAAFRQRLIEVANRIPDKNLASEYRSMLLERFFAERRVKPGAPKKPAVFARGSAPPDAGEANFRRGRLMLVTLLSHPALINDVDEAFARVALPPAYAKIRDALHEFAAGAKSLDTEGLFAHLSLLGLAEEARLIEALAAEDHRPDPDASLAEAAEKWWSWYILMDFSVEMLRAQRDELEQFWKAHQDDAGAWERLIKYNELLRQALAGEYGSAEN
ncbi:DNA primase [Acidocella aquatica]|uniref:DNA primase n=1 Tax=Acidocella aquatica TaxID=1922313 RepID=A0ABQ6A6M1_9PROT|nr:DNA primase [Acidocella aquatica]GLR67337.1 DNA primase [Acidocella aquatica]